jgi:uncharacterized protein YecE (DUF72 family)
MGELWIGTSGYSYKDWKEIFYPKGLSQKKWLAFYAQHYNTVEINATFYRYFPRTVFARWRDETPDNFRFTLKGPRDITHHKKLQDIESDLKRFLDSIVDLHPKLALLLWQFPYSFKYNNAKEDFAHFLQRLPTDIQQVFEFRNTSWFTDEVYAMLNKHKAGFIINDSSRFPAAEKITGDVAYIRFHGPTKLYASLYSTEALKKWAAKIKVWLKDDVYVYFNNDFGGRALQNSVELRQLILGN